jgi:hypothetical protein
MNKSKIEQSDRAGPAARKGWTRPSVTPLRAGAAEAIPGAVISDATLETIGS